MLQKSSEVAIGDLLIGGEHPLVVQSMTNTNTMDTEATVHQIEQLTNAGCQMVRITAQGMTEVKNLSIIKKELQKKRITIPLVADIHFQPKAAETAARLVEKVRINPGNYIDKWRNKIFFSEKEYRLELEKIAESLFPLVNICKEYGTAIRIGANQGSLSERILYKYGNTPAGMVASALEFVEIFRDMGFYNMVLSMKAGKVKTMVEANRLLVQKMIERNYYYPIHLGVTEAGAGEPARVKSAAGIGSLLATGIGDTLRISLTEDPVKEIPFAKKLALLYAKNNFFHEQKYVTQPEFFSFKIAKTKKKPPFVFTTDFSSIADYSLSDHTIELFRKGKPVFPLVVKFSYSKITFTELLIRVSVDVALLLESREIEGIWIDNLGITSADDIAVLSFEILQALKIRFSKTEFIACPSCGRTQFDIMEQLKKVQSALPNLKNLKIAVMGCVVNGMGEIADADYGYIGTKPGKVTLYKGKKVAIKNLPENRAIEELVRLIKSNGDWESD